MTRKKRHVKIEVELSSEAQEAVDKFADENNCDIDTAFEALCCVGLSNFQRDRDESRPRVGVV